MRDWPLGRVGERALGIVGIGVAGGLVIGGFWLPRPLMAPALTMGVVVGVATSFARVHLARGESARVVGGLVAAWSLILLVLGAWFLPAAEPYRFSRIVGERLAAASARWRVRPAIMTYQEPGVIYALGHAATDVRGYNEMFAEVSSPRGPLLLPLLPDEVTQIEGDPRFRLSRVETVHGFNLNKGKVQTLDFAIVSASAEAVARTISEDSRIK